MTQQTATQEERPGKAVEIRPEAKELLEGLGFERRGHSGGELVYGMDWAAAAVNVFARYGGGDGWTNLFRVEMRSAVGQDIDLVSTMVPKEDTPLGLLTEQTLSTYLPRLVRGVDVIFPRGRPGGHRRRGRGKAARRKSTYAVGTDAIDRLGLQTAVAGLIRSTHGDDPPGYDELMKAASFIVTVITARLRPDLLDEGVAKTEELLRVTQPDARTAVVALRFEGAVTDDERLARNIADALEAECLSGNGLADECCGEEGGWTKLITVTVNRSSAARDLRP